MKEVLENNIKKFKIKIEKDQLSKKNSNTNKLFD